MHCQIAIGVSKTVSTNQPPANRNRRSIYLLARHTYPLTFLRLFDDPAMDVNCTRRIPSATPLQSLALLSDPFMSDSADALASRAEKTAGAGAVTAGQIEALYLIALSRKPEPEELSLCEGYLCRQEGHFALANEMPAQAARHGCLESIAAQLERVSLH